MAPVSLQLETMLSGSRLRGRPRMSTGVSRWASFGASGSMSSIGSGQTQGTANVDGVSEPMSTPCCFPWWPSSSAHVLGVCVSWFCPCGFVLAPEVP